MRELATNRTTKAIDRYEDAGAVQRHVAQDEARAAIVAGGRRRGARRRRCPARGRRGRPTWHRSPTGCRWQRRTQSGTGHTTGGWNGASRSGKRRWRRSRHRPRIGRGPAQLVSRPARTEVRHFGNPELGGASLCMGFQSRRESLPCIQRPRRATSLFGGTRSSKNGLQRTAGMGQIHKRCSLAVAARHEAKRWDAGSASHRCPQLAQQQVQLSLHIRLLGEP